MAKRVSRLIPVAEGGLGTREGIQHGPGIQSSCKTVNNEGASEAVVAFPPVLTGKRR